MMTLVQKILFLYPQLNREDFHPMRGVILLQDDGEGAYIKKWDHPDFSCPTIEQLAQVEESAT